MTTPASKAAQPEQLVDAAAELPAVAVPEAEVPEAERRGAAEPRLQSLVALAAVREALAQPVGEAVADAVAPWSTLLMA